MTQPPTDEPTPPTQPTFGQPGPRDDSEIERALVVVAHPDDADFGAAGTIAGWTDAAVGVKDVRFLDGYRDGWLEPTWELQREIVRVIRDVQPQRVLIQSPERWYDRLQASHPDHLAAGEAAIRAVYPAAENAFAWPELVEEGLDPWHVGEVWVMAHPDMTHAVDITATFERKVAALRAHVSQTSHMDQLEEFLRGWSSAVAAGFGLGEGRLGECFKVTRLN